MRRIVFLLILFTTGNLIYCQDLFYYVIGDSVGVKDRQGKIIIPPVHRNLYGTKNKERVTSQFIKLPPKWGDTAWQTWGIVYNRKGKALYAPYFYDNGPDWIEEGMSRYVENNKIGFVNRAGDKVIKAQWDHVGQFDYGIAAFCNGCKWDYSEDSEHPSLKGGVWGYINIKGEELRANKEKKTEKDQKTEEGFLGYPFHYTLFEKKMLDSFARHESISQAYYVNHYSPLDKNERILRYEIVERPSSVFPYYHVKAFEFTNKMGYYGGSFTLHFYVSKDGKRYYFENYSDGLIPFNVWLNKYIEEARTYLKSHPDAPYKF